MKGISVEDYRRFHTDAEPFPDYLPYQAYEEGVVTLFDRNGRTSSIGMIWEIEPARLEAAAKERWEVVSEAVNGLLIRLPEEIACQFLLISDCDMREAVAPFLALTRADGFPRIACEDRARLYQHGSEGLFEHKGISFRPRRVRIFCTVRLWPLPPQRKGRFLSFLGSSEALDGSLSRWVAGVRSEIERIEEIIADSLKLAGIRTARLCADEVRALLWFFLNPACPDSPGPYHDHCLLREQLLSSHPTVDGQGVEMGGEKIVVLSAMEPPFETREGMLVRELEFGGTMASLLDLFPDLRLVLNIHIPNQQAAYTRIKRHKDIAWLQRLDPVAGLSVETQVIREELEKAINEVFAKGKRVLHTGVHALVSGKPEEVAGKINRVIAAMNRLGLRIVPEEIIGASLFLQCLPLGFDPRADGIMRRAHRFVSSNVADLVPVYGHFRGIGEPNFLYLSRRGEPVPFDAFDDTVFPAPHMLVIGSTGAGKSVFVNDMVLQAMRLPARIFVLDKGDSYGRLCRMLGGQHIVVEPEHPLTINPFSGPLDKEKQGILFKLVMEMAQGRVERDVLTREEEGIIEKAIVEAYERAGSEGEVILSHVAECLKEIGDEGRRLAFRLHPFLREGRYGRYFDGPQTFSLDNPFTVFELGRLNHDPDLQKVMIMVIIYSITHVVSELEKELRKLVFVDEAWALFASENAAGFLGEAARTYRKYRTAFVSITQQPRDFLESRGGRAVRDNSQIRILMMQAPEVAKAVGEELGLSPEKSSLFLSLESVPGKFSEALLETPAGSGVIRVVLPPSVYWISTTKEGERTYIDRLVRELGSLEAAIEQAVKEHPHGL